MYARVRAWVEKPPVNDKVVARQYERWVGGLPALSIAHELGLETVNELYQLRHFLKWPARHTYPSTKPRVPVTWTDEELARAREQWIALEPAKVIQKTLHLATRRRVYLVAEREGWPLRRMIRRKGEGPVTRLREITQEVVSESLRLRAAPPDELPTDHLARVCPRCDGRVTPEFGLRVVGMEDGEEVAHLVHIRCLELAQDRAA